MRELTWSGGMQQIGRKQTSMAKNNRRSLSRDGDQQLTGDSYNVASRPQAANRDVTNIHYKSDHDYNTEL